MITQPMLAGICTDVNKIKFPVLATPKLDGIRCLVVEKDGRVQAVSRNFKPIPNHSVRRWVEANCPVGFDGELMVPGSFQAVASAIMSREGTAEFVYRVFDFVSETSEPYHKRIDQLMSRPAGSHVELVLPRMISDLDALQTYETECLSEGYEGVMVRTPSSPYKCGRSTEREGYLLKIKRFVDGDAVVFGVVEKMHNANEATKDEFGHTEHSSHKAGMVPMGTLGSLIVRDRKTGVEFNIGSGFDDGTRAELWAVRSQLNGLIVKYKSQPTGVKNAPRFPVFLGFRSTLPEGMGT